MPPDFFLHNHAQPAAGDSPEHSIRKRYSRFRSIVWCALIVAIATVLRIIALGKTSFWLDEAASSMLARCDWHTFVTALLMRQSNMALYYLLLRGWIRFGNTEVAVRLLSVIFGVAAIPLLYRLGRLAFDDRTARIAALLMAINVFHIQYSQEARGYSLLVFLVILCCYRFVRLLASATRATLAAYIVTCILMVYAHLFGIWILLAQWVYALFIPGAPSLETATISAPVSSAAGAKKKIILGTTVTCALLSPLVFSLLFVSDRSQLSWMKPGSAASLYQILLDLSGSGGAPLLILYSIFLLVSLRYHFRNPKLQPAENRAAYALTWTWLLLPIILVEFISFFHPILQTRYLIICLPAFVLLAADGLAKIRSRLVFVASALAIAGMSLIAVNSYYRARLDSSHANNWRDATAYCLSHSQSGDIVLFSYSAEEIPFKEYQDRIANDRMGNRVSNVAIVPRETQLELLSTAGTWTSSTLVTNAAVQNRRVWVVSALQPNTNSEQSRAILSKQLKEESRTSFGFVTVQLFVPRQPESL